MLILSVLSLIYGSNVSFCFCISMITYNKLVKETHKLWAWIKKWYKGLLSYTQSVQQVGYGLDNWGSIPGIFLLTTVSRPALGPTLPPMKWVPCVVFLQVKQQGHDTDHSPPSSAEVKNVWSHTSTLEHVFLVWYLDIKYRSSLEQNWPMYWKC